MDLKVEYQKDPIGLDVNPRFSWKLESTKKNVMQKAYQIQVISEGKMIWDTGIKESDDSVLVPYEGIVLQPMTEYEAKVTVKDNYDQITDAAVSFETGMMTEVNFKAEWITRESKEEQGCPVFQKTFAVEKKKVVRARIYATACGIYEITLNGEKVGNEFFAPGWTSYHHRLQYQTYDITNQIKAKNDVWITVGNGWYLGYLGFDETPNHYDGKAAVRAMIFVEYEDGTKVSIGTDTGWTVTEDYIRSAEFYYGEVQDFTYSAQSSTAAILLDGRHKKTIGAITAQESEPVRITGRLSAIDMFTTPKGEIVLDFGQNLAGVVEVKLPRLSGEKLLVRHAETLDKEGNFYTENLRSAVSEDAYFYTEHEIGKLVMPHFTFHGFRYIAIEGVNKEDIYLTDFAACVLHTDMEETGTFTCDNEIINQLQSNIVWGQRGNFVDIPSDCPQRNERLGWTGDAQVFCNTAGYQFNTGLFFKKWLRDLAAETTPEFGTPHVIPNILGEQAGAAAWSDAATIIPWNLYQIYGDIQILEEQFDSMKMWVDYMRNNCNENGLWQTGFQYGDWLALDIEDGSTDRTGGTDKYLVANAYYAYSTKIMYQTAEKLEKKETAEKYKIIYEAIVEAINDEFITKTGRLVSETQTGCVLMLYFGLAKEKYRQRILETLEENIGLHRNHLTTGFVGTPYICHCLSEEGRHDLAEAIFLKEDFPSWFYEVKKGATTIWERWNSILPNGDFDESGMNSLNHYAYGSIGDWMYRKIAGINPLEPGYKKILIQPMLTHGMTEVKGIYESAYGTIKSAWSCKNGTITVDVTIPENTTAVLRLPEKEEIHVGSGNYHFAYETETSLEIQKFSYESTLGEIVAEELAVTMFNQMVPGMLDGPMIKFAYDMTMNELLAQAPDAKPMYDAVITALNTN